MLKRIISRLSRRAAVYYQPLSVADSVIKTRRPLVR